MHRCGWNARTLPLVSTQWRICFVWNNGDALDVEIVGDH